ncbi:hypothetical protein G6F24_018101 [Rhizopus arrhizus]|nr:hypothetical protein G6F24_018101 [Rhizopus arrhizus]
MEHRGGCQHGAQQRFEDEPRPLDGRGVACAVRAPRKRVVMMESPLSQCSYERDDSREGPDGHERILR